METEDGNDAVVEGIISLWNITSNGYITKEKEVSFEYDMLFQRSEENKMRLTLSHDRKIVSLAMQSNNKNHPGVKILAWKTRNLKQIMLPSKFLKNIN